MPRIADRAFDEEFSQARDALLKLVRERARAHQAALSKAAAAVDAEWTAAGVQQRLKDAAVGRAKRSGGSRADTSRARPSVNRVRAERLAWAVQEMVASAHLDGPENPLGSHQKQAVRHANATRSLIIAGLVLDPGAEEWLGGLTELAKCPWTATRGHGQPRNRDRRPARLQGYSDRGMVFRDWGHEAIRLLTKACVILGWVELPQDTGSEAVAKHRPVPMRVVAIDRPTFDTGHPLPDQVKLLRSVFDRFYEVLDATTIPVEEGRRVDGTAHAVGLSEATSDLHSELAATTAAVLRSHGVPQSKLPEGFRLIGAGSPQGPWTELPSQAIRVRCVSIGGSGADALLIAALNSAVGVTAYVAGRWNSKRAGRVAGPHQRWHAGDVVTNEDLAKLAAVQKLLGLVRVQAPAKKQLKAPKKPMAPLSEHQRMPDTPTVPVSLSKAAKWLGMSDWRAVKSSIEQGGTKGRQVSPQRWELDLGQIQTWAREEATPKPKRATPIPRV